MEERECIHCREIVEDYIEISVRTENENSNYAICIPCKPTWITVGEIILSALRNYEK